MQTDKQIHTLIILHPEWVFDLTGQPSPGPCEARSVVLKGVERRADHVLFPIDPTPDSWLTVVETQFYDDPEIYARIVVEMGLVQQDNGMREVRGIIFFRSAGHDPKTKPWRDVIQSFQFDELLMALEQREPDHPLVAVCQPLVVKNDKELEARARHDYHRIATSSLAEVEKRKLLDVFVSWLVQRLTNYDLTEIENMLITDLPEIEDTKAGRQLIERGRQRGIKEGIKEGRLDEKRKSVLKAFRARFGTVAKETERKVAALKSPKALDRLFEQVFQVASLDEIRWPD